MSGELRIFVPRLMDAANTNAQNLNAKALLSRFREPRARWITTHYDTPDAKLVAAPQVEVTKLWRRRLWHWHMLLKYQQRTDAIFYPGMEWFDASGLALRNRIGRRIPVIGTLEGLAGDEERERQFEEWLGHKVYCHRVPKQVIERCDRILHSCDHIIAITPMLAKLGQKLYGDKVSMLPLGIDKNLFRPVRERAENPRLKVVAAGTLTQRKRPEVFLQLAKCFPSIDFAWLGAGPLLGEMQQRAAELKLNNISFRGNLSQETLAGEYAHADLFILPSVSEGAPKVLQEAGACGLPRIAFGFYEPTITHDVDGYIVWSDDELKDRVSQIAANGTVLRPMRANAERASGPDWGIVANEWETAILKLVEQNRA